MAAPFKSSSESDGRWTPKGYIVSWRDAMGRYHEKLYSLGDYQKTQKAINWLVERGASNIVDTVVLDTPESGEITSGQARDWTRQEGNAPAL